MGIVYLAHEVALDRPVALKLLPAHLAAQPVLRERFLREARTAAKLSHPHIVPIYAVDEVRGFVFFAMAYVDGQTLGQRIRARGPLPAPEASRILREVAWALAYAHAQDVIHRDVKPDNILLETSTNRALVTDFGIAQPQDAPEATSVGEILGTAEFMSPEQASGEAIDGRSDLYALGCVGYYMLSGRLPFQGATVPAILAQHITQPAAPLTSAAPDAPARLARTIDRCLAKEPDERFANGESLAEALAEAVTGRRELPLPLRVFLKQGRQASRSTSGLAVLTLFFILPVTMSAAVTGKWGIALLGIALGAGVLAFPRVSNLLQLRKAARAGYGLEDLRLAIREDVVQHEEEIRFQFGRGRGVLARIGRPALWASLGVAAVSAGVALAFPGWPDVTTLWSVVSLSVIGAGTSGIVLAQERYRTRDVWGKRAQKLWNSKFGGWLYRLATRGASRGAVATGVTHRPTELAIGLAADRLFDDLPKTVRAQLPDLPKVVRGLEATAQAVRARIEELNALLAEVTNERTDTAADRRSELKERLERERQGAERRQREVVTALETVRLNLLRMHAGVGTVQSVTADLAAARDVSDAVTRLAQGQEEVERLLAQPGTPAP
jgi:eukaryotic-like serine/threonine-protein kinase